MYWLVYVLVAEAKKISVCDNYVAKFNSELVRHNKLMLYAVLNASDGLKKMLVICSIAESYEPTVTCISFYQVIEPYEPLH